MKLSHRIADLICPPGPPPPGGFANDLGPEVFGALDEQGGVYIIGYRGEWYSIAKPSLRVRLHNRYVRWLDRNREHDKEFSHA
jgi:hypothetical protein